MSGDEKWRTADDEASRLTRELIDAAVIRRPAHYVWLTDARRRLCTCPLAGDHGPNAVGPGRLTPYTLCQECGAFEHAAGRCPYT